MSETHMLNTFIRLHEPQISRCGIPAIFLPYLYFKLKNEIFDAGEAFQIIETEGNSSSQKVIVIRKSGILKSDGNEIYLIDHAWIFEGHKVQECLTSIPGLLERMSKLMRVESSCVESEVWKYNQTYSIMSDDNIEKQMPLWYVMDEFGCAIRHSDEPNFRTVPFIYVPTGVSYTLLFPVKDVANGEEVTRDFVYGVTDILLRKALLLPWKSSSFRDIEFQGVEVDEEYFIQGRLIDTLPTVSQQSNFLTDDCNHSLKIYSEYKYINEYLKLSNFEFVDDPESADILWFTSHFKDYKKLSLEAPHKFVNQFPFENVITVKDLLYYVCKRAGCNEIATNKLFGPSWLITSYNLKLELPQFISYFQHCSDLQLDNYWICKPWNLARGLDTLITNNLNCIIRQSTSGPKICQKYITNPLLFYRDSIGKVKFDIRYIVLLKSVQPLRAYVYKNFFLRFANKPFDLSNLNDYEKHFTVMNYNNDAKLCKMLCNEFVFQFCQQYPDNEWCVIENKILLMIREILVAATSEDPPCGIGVSPQSRALYGIDLILEETEHNGIVPRLLEVNWLPDCKRACEYYPEFYNDVFSALFLNINNGSMYEL